MYGKILRNARLKNGVTQTELGKRIGKSKQWVSEFERGNIRLNMDVAVRLANALGILPDIFMSARSKKNGQMKND